MPELPEVENFRRLLLPLISETNEIHLERLTLDRKPPRKFLSDEDISHINQQKYRVKDVLRRGKLICMVITVIEQSSSTKKGAQQTDEKYLLIHMGMTGRISTPDYIPILQELKETTEFPPPHTYLKFSTSNHQACFSDPRKFGSILLVSSKEEFDELAPDAWTEMSTGKGNNGDDGTQETTGTLAVEPRKLLLEKISNQSIGIKALLLDQKRVVAGVGNWVADEVLYQTKIHPDQNYLTTEQAEELLTTLHIILETAVNALEKRLDFPSEWLFHYRWNSRQTTKDAKGRTITFITSGGRTSAVVASIQKKRAQGPKRQAAPTVEKGTTSPNNSKKAKSMKKADIIVSSEDIVETQEQSKFTTSIGDSIKRVKNDIISNKETTNATKSAAGKIRKKTTSSAERSESSTVARRRSPRLTKSS